MPDPVERRARLSIDVSTTIRRRVRLAAARRDQSIRDYVVDALAERLHEDLGDERPDEAGALTEGTDPVLGRLWRNAADAVYDDMIIRKIGALPPEELANVEAALRVSLALVEAK